MLSGWVIFRQLKNRLCTSRNLCFKQNMGEKQLMPMPRAIIPYMKAITFCILNKWAKNWLKFLSWFEACYVVAYFSTQCLFLSCINWPCLFFFKLCHLFSNLLPKFICPWLPLTLELLFKVCPLSCNLLNWTFAKEHGYLAELDSSPENFARHFISDGTSLNSNFICWSLTVKVRLEIRVICNFSSFPYCNIDGWSLHLAPQIRKLSSG